VAPRAAGATAHADARDPGPPGLVRFSRTSGPDVDRVLVGVTCLGRATRRTEFADNGLPARSEDRLLFARRFPLAAQFMRRELRNRFAGSFSGSLWALFPPLLPLAANRAVFVHLCEARLPGAGAPGYVEFLAIALWPWAAFAGAVLPSTTAIEDN